MGRSRDTARSTRPDPCPPKPALRRRPLINADEAAAAASVFKVLANDTRLRLLHALCRSGDLCVTDLAAAVGMKPQAVSNQLQRLVDRGILGQQRNGSHVHYRIVDPCATQLLHHGLCLTQDASERRP